MSLTYLNIILELLDSSKLKLDKTNALDENGDKILMKCQGNVSQELKCVLALEGDKIYDADIKLVRGNTSRISYNTSIKPQFGECYRLQQLQDCFNIISQTIEMIQRRQHTYSNVTDESFILNYHFVMEIMNNLREARETLTNPKRKSIEEHISDYKRKYFHPTLPHDIAISFFIRDTKLILAVYILDISYPHGTSFNSAIGSSSNSSQSRDTSSTVNTNGTNPTKSHSNSNIPRYELAGRITVDSGEINWLRDVLDNISQSIYICMHLANQLKS